MGVLQRHVAGDLAAADEADEGLVHRRAAERGAGGDGVGDLRRVARADQVADRVRDDHQLTGEHAPAALLGDKLLRQHRLEAHRKLQADLRLHRLGEDLDNTVDCVGGAAGMQGAEDKVAGLGGGDGRLDGVLVAHFADENDVRVLTKAGAQPLGEALGILADLALVDRAQIGGVHVFHRVFQRDDVRLAMMVYIINHRREARRFTGAGFARDKDDALVLVRQLHRGGRQAQLGQIGDLVAQQTQRHGGVALLLEQMDTAAVAREGFGRVQLADAHELFEGRVASRKVAGQTAAFLLVEHLVAHVFDLAVLAVLGRQAADDMNIGSAVLLGLRNQPVNRNHKKSSFVSN